MNREQAFQELTEYSILELLLKDANRNYGRDGLISMSELVVDFFRERPENEKLLEELSEQTLSSVDLSHLKDLPREMALEEYSHYKNEVYALSETEKIKLVKHSRFNPGQKHDHEFFEIAFQLTGQCSHVFYLGQGIETTTIREGELVIIPPGLSHSVEIFDDSVMVNILIHRQTFLSAFLNQLPENNTLYRFFSRALLSDQQQSYILVQNTDGELKNLLLDLYIQQQTDDRYSPLISEHILSVFFLQLLRNNETTMILSNQVDSREGLVAAMLLYMENNYREISLAQVADQFHFSKTYANRIIKEATGQTVLQLIRSLRMSQAKKLLQDPDLSVAKVAEMVGYNDTSYFIEEYKKTFGKTPKADR